MVKRLRKIRPTYSGVASTVALVLAVGTGGAYAAAKIHTRDLANGAVTNSKLHKNAVTAAKIKDGSVGKKDLSLRARGTSAWEVIPSGVTVTGLFRQGGHSALNTRDYFEQQVNLPAVARNPLDQVHLLVAPNDFPQTSVDDSCTGNPTAPSAPRGDVCVYFTTVSGSVSTLKIQPEATAFAMRRGFHIVAPLGADGDWQVEGAWAYTAP